VSWLVALQFLQYAFLPAIDPNTIDKGDEAYRVIIETNFPLVIETLIAFALLYWFNRSILKKVKLESKYRNRINLLALGVGLVVVLSFMGWFSLEYYFAMTKNNGAR
jgi:hypothetical protein